jgi:hypothetical protein
VKEPPVVGWEDHAVDGIQRAFPNVGLSLP